MVTTFWVIDELPGEQGFDHPEYPINTIHQSHDRGDEYHLVIIFGGGFGALSCLFVVVGLTLGLNRRQQAGIAPWVFAATAVIYASLFLLVVYLNWHGDRFAVGPWGFPISTAVMMFVFVPSQLVIVALYMATFPRWILPPEELARFEELIAERQAVKREENGS